MGIGTAGLIGLAFCASTMAAELSLVGITYYGEVHRIDLASGASTLIGDSGFLPTTCMGKDASGRIYSMGHKFGEPTYSYSLFSIDPATGAGTLEAALAPISNYSGMAFMPDGVLMAVRQSVAGDSPRDLYRVDPAAGTHTLIGSTGAQLWSLAASSEGRLYSYEGLWWDTSGRGLVEINPLTGVATDVNGSAGATESITAMAFSPGGELYALECAPNSYPETTALYSIDTATGATTLLWRIPMEEVFYGFEFVPEPAGWTAVMLALGCLARRRRIR